MDATEAMDLGRKLWTQIERRRYSSGTDSTAVTSNDQAGFSGWRTGVTGMLNYYRGKHPLRFASDQFTKYFDSRFAGFSDNWCAPVIDAAAERMNWNGMRLGGGTQKADVEFMRVMNANDVDRGCNEAFTVMLAGTRSYGLVWGNPKDDQTPRVTFEQPEYCALATDPDTGEVTAGAKGWLDDHKGYLTLYTADEVWKWQWQVNDDNDPRRQVNWEPRIGDKDDTWPIPNPMGRVPMVEFRNRTLLDDKPLSDIAGVAAMQDAVNLLWAYLFNSLDFASLPQRVVTGADMPKIPILDDQGQVVGEKNLDLALLMEKRVLWLPDPDAKIQSWPSADLKVFTDVLGIAVDHIAAQTRTPPHYLIGKMANMAAEALTVAETGLVARVMQKISFANRPIRDMHSLVALAKGEKEKAKAALTGRVLWADPQYRSLSQKIDAFQKMRQAGLPLEWMLEWYGLAPDEVERVMAMAKSEADTLVSPSPIKATPGAILPKGLSELPVSAPETEPAAGDTADGDTTAH